jgi:hypothetical protein
MYTFKKYRKVIKIQKNLRSSVAAEAAVSPHPQCSIDRPAAGHPAADCPGWGGAGVAVLWAGRLGRPSGYRPHPRRYPKVVDSAEHAQVSRPSAGLPYRPCKFLYLKVFNVVTVSL